MVRVLRRLPCGKGVPRFRINRIRNVNLACLPVLSIDIPCKYYMFNIAFFSLLSVLDPKAFKPKLAWPN